MIEGRGVVTESAEVKQQQLQQPLEEWEYSVVIPNSNAAMSFAVQPTPKGETAFKKYVSLQDGSPGLAEQFRMIRHAGDVIVQIDGASTAGKTFPQVLKALLESAKRSFSCFVFRDSHHYVVQRTELENLLEKQNQQMGTYQEQIAYHQQQIVEQENLLRVARQQYTLTATILEHLNKEELQRHIEKVAKLQAEMAKTLPGKTFKTLSENAVQSAPKTNAESAPKQAASALTSNSYSSFREASTALKRQSLRPPAPPPPPPSRPIGSLSTRKQTEQDKEKITIDSKARDLVAASGNSSPINNSNTVKGGTAARGYLLDDQPKAYTPTKDRQRATNTPLCITVNDGTTMQGNLERDAQDSCHGKSKPERDGAQENKSSKPLATKDGTEQEGLTNSDNAAGNATTSKISCVSLAKENSLPNVMSALKSPRSSPRKARDVPDTVESREGNDTYNESTVSSPAKLPTETRDKGEPQSSSLDFSAHRRREGHGLLWNKNQQTNDREDSSTAGSSSQPKSDDELSCCDDWSAPSPDERLRRVINGTPMYWKYRRWVLDQYPPKSPRKRKRSGCNN